MLRLRRRLIVVVSVGLLAFIGADIPYPYDEINEINSANIQNSGHTNQYETGTYLLANFNDGTKGLFFKQCSICSIMWQEVGHWGGSAAPPSAVCDADSTVPGCKPTEAPNNLTAIFGGCSGSWSTWYTSWSSVPYATFYEVAKTHNHVTWLQEGTPSSTSQMLDECFDTWITVRACSNYGCGPWSSEKYIDGTRCRPEH